MAPQATLVNDFENFERERRRFLFGWLWVLANTLGVAGGWALGETLGRLLGQTYGWALGMRVGWVIFEIILWLARSVVLLMMRELNPWRGLDIIIWLASELIGELLGEGILETQGPVWLTGGALWGTIGGAQVWLAFWFVIQPQRTTRWHPLSAAGWALLALVGGSFLFAVALTVALELGNFVGQTLHPTLGWGIAGAITGCCVGAVTGLAFLRLFKWQTRQPSVP